METVKSKNGVTTRLTAERWLHITRNHDDLAGYYDEILSTVEEPDYIVEGYRGAHLAVRNIAKGMFLVVVYKETTKSDGFIVTAYLTSKIKLEEEKVIWQKKASRREPKSQSTSKISSS